MNEELKSTHKLLCAEHNNSEIFHKNLIKDIEIKSSDKDIEIKKLNDCNYIKNKNIESCYNECLEMKKN